MRIRGEEEEECGTRENGQCGGGRAGVINLANLGRSRPSLQHRRMGHRLTHAQAMTYGHARAHAPARPR